MPCCGQCEVLNLVWPCFGMQRRLNLAMAVLISSEFNTQMKNVAVSASTEERWFGLAVFWHTCEECCILHCLWLFHHPVKSAGLAWLCFGTQMKSVKLSVSVSASSEEVSKLRAQLQQSLMSKKMSDEMCNSLQVTNFTFFF